MPPFHMTMRKRFGTFTCAPKTVSKQFQNGLKSVYRNLLCSPSKQFSINHFRGVIKWWRKDAYGANARRGHCWRFGAKERSSGSFGRLSAMTSCSRRLHQYWRGSQCRGKVKALKNKYKQIVDKLRRSGTGCESDEESKIPGDFSYFAVLDAVLGKRASVTSVQLLDTAEVSQHDTSTSRPITPSHIAAISEEPLSPVQTSGPLNTVDTAEMGKHDSPELCSHGPSASKPSTPSPTAAFYKEPPSIVQTSGPSSSHEEPPNLPKAHSTITQALLTRLLNFFCLSLRPTPGWGFISHGSKG